MLKLCNCFKSSRCVVAIHVHSLCDLTTEVKILGQMHNSPCFPQLQPSKSHWDACVPLHSSNYIAYRISCVG